MCPSAQSEMIVERKQYRNLSDGEITCRVTGYKLKTVLENPIFVQRRDAGVRGLGQELKYHTEVQIRRAELLKLNLKP